MKTAGQLSLALWIRSDNMGGWLDGLRSRGPVPADRRYAQLSFPGSRALEETGESAAVKPQLLDNLMEETPTKNDLGIEGGLTFVGNSEVTPSRTAPKGVAVAQKIDAPR